MANHKTGKDFICPQCGKTFYVPGHRISKHKNHYCSLKCLSMFTAKARAEKLRKKEYPFIAGKCIYCDKDIVIQNAAFDKPNRKFCSYSCKIAYRNKNVPQTEAQRIKSAERAKKTFTGREVPKSQRLNMARANIGEKSHFWKGGFTTLARSIRNSNLGVEWRNNVFIRDNYTCQNCGARNGNGYTVYLEADHIIPFSVLFNEFIALYKNLKKQELFEKALSYQKFWDVNNGRTLCSKCHKNTTTFSYKAGEFVISENNEGIYKKPN